MFKYIKEHYGRYIHSSLITFLAIFVPMLLVIKDSFNVETLNQASLLALAGVVARVAVKALWETVWIYIAKLNVYLKQKYGK